MDLKYSENWNKYTFLQLVRHLIDFRGRTPLKIGMQWGGEILSLSANNVRDGYIDFETDAHYGSEELYKKWMTKGDCKKGDIIFTMEAPLGNVAQIPDKKKYILSQRVVLLKTNNNIIENSFLSYLMRGDEFQKELIQKSTGSTVTGIQQKKLNKFELLIPPINQQKKIAKILSTIDNLIEKTQILINKYTVIKQGMLADLFSRGIDLSDTPETNPDYGQLRPSAKDAPELYKNTELGWIPKEWEKKSLLLTSESIGDGVHYSVKRIEEGIPFLFVSCVRHGEIKWDKSARISKETYNIISRKSKPYEGMILFTAVGSYGHVAYVKNTTPFGFERNIAYIKPLQGIIIPKFMFYFMVTRIVRDQVESLVMGNAQKLISLSNLGRINMLIPNFIEQEIIVKKMDSIEVKIKNEFRLKEKYLKIKKGLMQDLLTGKVLVTL